MCFYRDNTIIADDYLKTSLANILEKKKNNSFCKKCMKYGFPLYLLGVNRKGWQDRARKNAEQEKLAKSM